MTKYLASFWDRQGHYRQGFVEAISLREAKIKANRKYGNVIEVFEWLPSNLF